MLKKSTRGFDMTNFYLNFVNLCDKKNLKPTAAAIEMGFSRAAPSAWKRHDRIPQDTHLNTIARFFGVTIEELLSAPVEVPKEDIKKEEPADVPTSSPNSELFSLMAELSKLPPDRQAQIIAHLRSTLALIAPDEADQ